MENSRYQTNGVGISGFNNGRQTGISPDLPIIVRCERDVCLEPITNTGWIRHVRGQESAAAIKLKIKVTSAVFRLDEKILRNCLSRHRFEMVCGYSEHTDLPHEILA